MIVVRKRGKQPVGATSAWTATCLTAQVVFTSAEKAQQARCRRGGAPERAGILV